MKKVWRYLVEQLKEDFSLPLYLVVLGFLALAISLNYYFDFRDSIIDNVPGMRRIGVFFIFYSVAYFSVVFMVQNFSGPKRIALTRAFWVKSIFGILLLSLDSGFAYMRDVVQAIVPLQASFWAYKVGLNLMSVVTVLIPIFIYCRFFDPLESKLYGLANFRFDWKPYLTMLAIMIPVIIGASFLESFQHQYPMYPYTQAHLALRVPEWVTVAGYEFAYAFDFITVEFFFRGFLVLGMMEVLGRKSILPMAAVYCFLHFGKPPGEAISSIFGGYLLGVIAYETRSIWGGIIVHIGIALMMEVAAYLQDLV